MLEALRCFLDLVGRMILSVFPCLVCSRVSVFAYFPSPPLMVRELESSSLSRVSFWGETRPLCLPCSTKLYTSCRKQESGSRQARGWSGPGQKKALKVPGADCLSARPDPGLRGGHTPVLRPSVPGSVTVACVGAGFMLLFWGLWQLLQLWGGSLVFPPTPTFKGCSSLPRSHLTALFFRRALYSASTCHCKQEGFWR